MKPKLVKTLRIVLPLLFIAIITIGFLTSGGIGTLSALGWKDVAWLCPVGALSTMLASKTIFPRALISLVLAVVAILLLGRAFCGWVCPVPIVSKIRYAFTKKGAKKDEKHTGVEAGEVDASPLSEDEKRLLGGCSKGCAGKKLDTRQFVLGGSLLSAAIFGFPVFCLICPIGLTFAAILLLIRAFGFGDPSLTLLVVLVLLAVEVIFFKKWCHAFCPVGALMSLISRGNKTFRPTVDPDKCLETTKGVTCSACARVCPEGINLHELGKGSVSLAECTKCHACVDVCPTHALTMPFLPPKAEPKAPESADADKA